MHCKLCPILALVLIVGLAAGCAGDSSSSSDTDTDTDTDTDSGEVTASTPTGIVTADGFHIAYDSNPVIAVSDSGSVHQEVVVTVYTDDINDQIASGHTVKFRTEWGTFLDSDSCVLDNGTCSITWMTGDFDTRPPGCIVAFTAWTIGEETFGDVNANKLFDDTEFVLGDQTEPTLDIHADRHWDDALFQYPNDDYTYEGVPKFIDMNIWNGDESAGGGRDGELTPADGLYTGSLCASDNSARCTTQTSRVIFDESYLYIASSDDIEDFSDGVCDY